MYKMRICRKLSYELKELYESMLSPEERERLPPMFSHPHALIPFLTGNLMPVRQRNDCGHITYTIRGEVLRFLETKNKKICMIAEFDG
jgi:hypothetical protein